MASTPATFAQKITGLAAGLPGVATVGTKAVCLDFKKTALALAPRRLRNVGRRGTRLSVVYKVFGENTPTVRAEIVAVPPGPWKMIESGTKPHMIPRKRRRGNTKAVRLPDGGVRLSVPHPGTSGKHPWAKTKALVGARAPKVYQKALHAEMQRHFGF